MNLTWTPELRRFREEVAAFAAASLPPDIRDKVLRHQRLERDDYVRWHLVLADRGWGAPTWPVEHGGTGWNALQRLIFEVECFKAGAPRLLPFGLSMIGPVLMKYGSAAQQAELLPRIIRVQDWWCQGYSEPGSGSDLASLSTRAERDGGEYVVNGQKTWTTLAQYADRMFCLVRTDHGARAQRGISMLLLDMRAPGVSVRPIRTLDGGCDVNEVWLENVRVPAVNLVGKRTRAGPTPSTCSATSVPASPGSGIATASWASSSAWRGRRLHGAVRCWKTAACATAFRASRPTSWRWRCCCCAWPPATAARRAPRRRC